MDSMFSGLPQPILVGESWNSRELALIIADDGVSKGKGLGSNQEVIAAYRSASLFQPFASAISRA